MNKKSKRIVSILLLMLMMVMLSSCGLLTILSGTYVSVSDSSKYFEFSGLYNVDYHSGTSKTSHRYIVEKQKIADGFYVEMLVIQYFITKDQYIEEKFIFNNDRNTFEGIPANMLFHDVYVKS